MVPFWPELPAALGAQTAALLGLSVEDTVYSFAAIALGATWTDCTRAEDERVRISRVENLVITPVSTVSAAVSYTAWARASEGGAARHGGLYRFAHYATAMGVVGGVLMLSGLWWLCRLESRRAKLNKATLVRAAAAEHTERSEAHDAGHAGAPGVRRLLWSFGRVTLRHRNFGCFCVMSVLAEVQATFNSEFGPIIVDVFLRPYLAAEGRAAYLAAEQFSVLLAALALSVVAQSCGVKAVYLYATLTKTLLGVLMLVLPANGLIGALYFFVCNMATSGAGAFWMVLMAGVADEHGYIASDGGRRVSASIVSLYMGCHALLAKPADSLAPVLGSAVLESVGCSGGLPSPSPSPSPSPGCRQRRARERRVERRRDAWRRHSSGARRPSTGSSASCLSCVACCSSPRGRG